MEGPFWKEIRGLGLSYGYDIHVNQEQGFDFTTHVALDVKHNGIVEFRCGDVCIVQIDSCRQGYERRSHNCH
jgi:hypothetical protein